jgi:hypothetical protein
LSVALKMDKTEYRAVIKFFVKEGILIKCALFCILFANWHSPATLTEVFPCFFLSCKANGIPREDGARSALFLISELCCSVYCLCRLCYSMYCLCVNVYCTTVTGCQTQLQLNMSGLGSNPGFRGKDDGNRLSNIITQHKPTKCICFFIFFVFNMFRRGRVSSVGIAIQYKLDGLGIESEIFCTRPDRPWGPPSLLYNGYRVIPMGKAAGA